jgi:uncharacterized protein Yka (UPF0111/DUF47 family)
MARFSLVPRNSTFDDLLQGVGDIAHHAAATLVQLLDVYPESVHLTQQVKQIEHDGDTIMRRVVHELRHSFVTPYDREDIYGLAQAIDDVIDHIEEGVALFDIYQVNAVPEHAKHQAALLQRATYEIAMALRSLDKPQITEGHWQTVHTIEDEGDALFRAAMKQLVSSCYDEPTTIICWRDIYRQFEDAIDSCERAATVLEAVGVKHG